MRTGVSKVADIMKTLADLAAKPKEMNENTSFLNHVESLLAKLPKAAVEDIQSKIIAMLYAEISIHRNNVGGL